MKKPRVSKQKSCVFCARSKLKCSLDYPSCERCNQRGSPCEYPTSPINSPQASLEHYPSRERNDRNGSGGTDLLSPYSVYSNDDLYGTPRSRSASATSQSSSNVGSHWDQSTSSFALADPSPFTEFPLYSPGYSVGSFGSNLGASSISNYTQPQSSTISYLDTSGFRSLPTHLPNSQYYGDSSQHYPSAGSMDLMTADPYSSSSTSHKSLGFGNNSMSPTYSFGMPYNYGSQQPQSQGYGSAVMQSTHSRTHSGQGSAYSGGSSGARHVAPPTQSISYAMGYEPSHARGQHTSSAYEIRPQRRR